MLLFCTFMTGICMIGILDYDDSLTWSEAFLFGAIVSATDPVAVVAMLKELGASIKMSTLIEGESLLNDATAMVTFLVVLVYLTPHFS